MWSQQSALTRETNPTGDKELDHFAKFWCGKGLRNQGWGYREDLMKHIM
jgi:hypothetical protein